MVSSLEAMVSPSAGCVAADAAVINDPFGIEPMLSSLGSLATRLATLLEYIDIQELLFAQKYIELSGHLEVIKHELDTARMSYFADQASGKAFIDAESRSFEAEKQRLISSPSSRPFLLLYCAFYHGIDRSERQRLYLKCFKQTLSSIFAICSSLSSFADFLVSALVLPLLAVPKFDTHSFDSAPQGWVLLGRRVATRITDVSNETAALGIHLFGLLSLLVEPTLTSCPRSTALKIGDLSDPLYTALLSNVPLEDVPFYNDLLPSRRSALLLIRLLDLFQYWVRRNVGAKQSLLSLLPQWSHLRVLLYRFKRLVKESNSPSANKDTLVNALFRHALFISKLTSSLFADIRREIAVEPSLDRYGKWIVQHCFIVLELFLLDTANFLH